MKKTFLTMLTALVFSFVLGTTSCSNSKAEQAADSTAVDSIEMVVDSVADSLEVVDSAAVEVVAE